MAETRQPSTAPAQSGYSDPDEEMAFAQTPIHSFRIDRYELSELKTGDFFASPNQIPRVNLTIRDAKDICRTLGRRLCSAFEWTNACLGANRKRFGYGNSKATRTCNLQGPSLALTGSFRHCRTDGDVYDMIGNAMEWVENPDEPDRAMAAGGSFDSSSDTDCFALQAFPPETQSTQIGFRCCK